MERSEASLKRSRSGDDEGDREEVYPLDSETSTADPPVKKPKPSKEQDQSYVINRHGEREPIRFDRITDRIVNLANMEPAIQINAPMITKSVIECVVSDIHTSEIDDHVAWVFGSMITKDPDYGIMASRFMISNLHKQTKPKFSEFIDQAWNYTAEGVSDPLVHPVLHSLAMKHKDVLDAAIVDSRDYGFTPFGLGTIFATYLISTFPVPGQKKVILERPQYMYMRVALWIHREDIKMVLKAYDLMSRGFFTHATPTLVNSGINLPQLASCFLLTMTADSLDDIYSMIKNAALISKGSGGIGIAVSSVRAAGSLIKSTRGKSDGIVPMLRVVDTTCAYVNQGGNKRPGAIAVYLEPWHRDIREFLNLADFVRNPNHTKNLFYALWVTDLFMRRVRDRQEFTLFSPSDAPLLATTWGKEHDRLYEEYERTLPSHRKTVVSATDLWKLILDSIVNTGGPYILYKDACNALSNHQHLGTIRCSNLCTEIIQYTSEDEIAVCNLASISLPSYYDPTTGKYDFLALSDTVQLMVTGLNRGIDINHYPVPEASRSNLRHRPLGLGIQGLADLFILMRLPWEGDDRVLELMKAIMEVIYFSACRTSNELAISLTPPLALKTQHLVPKGAREYPGAYPSFKGSPIERRGEFHMDLFAERTGVTLESLQTQGEFSDAVRAICQWESLRKSVDLFGLRNSLFVAPMPTASTSQILGNNECFEPFRSNIFSRKVLSGEYQIINKHLVKDLKELGLWNDDIRIRIIEDEGSVQNISEIPPHIRALYKTAWEIKQKRLIQLQRARAPWVDQAESANRFVSNKTRLQLEAGKMLYPMLSSMLFEAWSEGLKNGLYYCHWQAPTTGAKKTRISSNGSGSTTTTTGGNHEKTTELSSKTSTEAATSTGEICIKGVSCDSCGS